jgi:hypothetical protein
LKDKRRIQFEILDALAELAMLEFRRAKLAHGFGFVITQRDEEAAERQTELQRAELYMAKVRKEIAFARKGTAALQDSTLERLAKEIDSAEKPTFVWQLDFAEVFHKRLPSSTTELITVDKAGASKDIAGFDIIVGNPPYVRIQNLPAALAKKLKTSFRSATGKFDIYVCFIEKGLSLIRSGNSWIDC